MISLAKIYFNPKYHDSRFFKVLPLLFSEVYFNAEYTDLNDELLKLINNKVIIPVFSDEDSVPKRLEKNKFIVRENLIDTDEFFGILDEVGRIGPKLSFISSMSKEYTEKEFTDLFSITNWDLIVSNYLGCNELAFEDLIKLRRRLFINSLHELEDSYKPTSVSKFIQNRRVTLPTNLLVNDLVKFRKEKLFLSFNDWVDREENTNRENQEKNTEKFGEQMSNSYQHLLDEYAHKRAVQGGLTQVAISLTAVQLGIPPAESIVTGFVASKIPSILHPLLAKEKWVYWLANIENVPRNR